jgi:hypothetical protein
MKKVYGLFTLLCLLSLGAFAQSLSIVHSETHPYGDVNEFIIATHATVKNVSGDSLDVKVKRIEEDIIEGTINYFCWKNCYVPSVSVSPDFVRIGPGEEKADFVGDYESNKNAGTSTVRYVFYDMNNEDDSVSMTVNYLVTAVGIEENVWAVNDPYPNPANTTVTFDYNAGAFGDALVSIYDMLGNVRKEAKMLQGMSRMVMDVADLEPGVYFYSIKIDNQTSITKKMIVSRS